MYQSNKIRLIARLDIKSQNLIKGVHLEGLRVMGDPNEFAVRYYEQGIDELIYLDTVASLYGRNHLAGIIEKTVQNVFVPITVAGGIRSLDDAKELLRLGADRVAINTAAIERPSLISEISQKFGAQCVVLNIEANRIDSLNSWECYTNNGREPSGHDVVEWAVEAARLGAGEILLTSVNREGTRKGFDVALVNAVSEAVQIPVIASGGMGSVDHLVDVVERGGCAAVAMADILHYDRMLIRDIRNQANAKGINTRRVE